MLGKIDCVRFVYDFHCASNILTGFIYINVNFNQYLNNGQIVYAATSLLTLDQIYFLVNQYLNLESKRSQREVYLYTRKVCSYSAYKPVKEWKIGILGMEWEYLINNTLEHGIKKVNLI